MGFELKINYESPGAAKSELKSHKPTDESILDMLKGPPSNLKFKYLQIDYKNQTRYSHIWEDDNINNDRNLSLAQKGSQGERYVIYSDYYFIAIYGWSGDVDNNDKFLRSFDILENCAEAIIQSEGLCMPPLLPATEGKCSWFGGKNDTGLDVKLRQ